MRHPDAYELHVNGHPKGLIARRDFIGAVALHNLPQNRITLLANTGIATIQELKDLLAVKAATDEVATNLQVLRDIPQESIKLVLGLKHVVKGKHTTYHIRLGLESASHLILHIGRHHPRRLHASQSTLENHCVLGTQSSLPRNQVLGHIAHYERHGQYLLTPISDHGRPQALIGSVSGTVNAVAGDINTQNGTGIHTSPLLNILGNPHTQVNESQIRLLHD